MRIIKKFIVGILMVILADWVVFFIFWPFLSKEPFFHHNIDNLRQSIRNPTDLFGKVDSPFEKKKDSEFVVGIFGGSFAAQLPNDVNLRKIPSVKNLEKKIGKKIRWESYALQGGSYPIQYNALHVFSNRIDAAVFLDGFNELIMPLTTPPQACNESFWKNNKKSSTELLHSLIPLKKELTSFVDSPTWNLMYFSGLYKMYFFYHDVVTNRKVDRFFRTMDIHKDVTVQDKAISYTTNADFWKQCVQLSYGHASSIKLPIIFFVQPNQYIKGSKEFTKEEKQQAFYTSQELSSNHPQYRTLPKGYIELDKRITQLSSQNIPVYTLKDIFKYTSETIYKDTCCHVNVRGNEIVTEEIFKKLSEVLCEEKSICDN